METIHGEMQAHAAQRHRAAERPDRWTQLRLDFQIALDEMMAPEIVQIMLIDAPSVLGWKRWREHRQQTGLAAIRKAIETSITDGLIPDQPAIELAHLLSASFNEATMLIAYAEDKAEARVNAGSALDAVLAGLAQIKP
jgi:hypothetical protein